MKILAVEDNPADVEMIRELLPWGHASAPGLVSTDTLTAAREVLDGDGIDVILLDLGLPDSQGIDTLRTLRASYPTLPIVVLTGFDDDETGTLALREGAQDYLVKGRIDGPSLVRAIRYSCERNRIEQEMIRKNRVLDGMNEELAAANNSLRQNVEKLTRQEQELRERKDNLKKGNRRLAILAESGRLLLSSHAPEQIVHTICTQVMGDLDCQAFFNYLIEDGKERMVLNACAGIPDAVAREIHTLDFGVAVCGCVARDGLPCIAENISGPDIKTDLVRSFGITAYACHPLIYQGRTIGTLSFGTKTRTRFSPEDIGMMSAITDLVAAAMARRKAEDALKEALAEKEVLLSEIHHRVKNNLAAFISLLSLEGSYEESPAGLSLKKDLQNRARSMALIHDTLYRTRMFSVVDMGVYIATLTDQVADSYRPDRLVEKIVRAECVSLDLNRATPCGLIVNELITNVYKYAFPESFDCMAVRGEPCTLRVTFSLDGGYYLLTVSDNGVGLPGSLDPFTSKSLGLKLVNFLARHQLRATVGVRSEIGTEFSIRFAEKAEGNHPAAGRPRTGSSAAQRPRPREVTQSFSCL